MPNGNKPRLGCSACLLGERVRYDGELKPSAWVQRVAPRLFELVPLCPEVGMGLGVPRPSIHLVDGGDGVRLLREHDGLELTAALQRWLASVWSELGSVHGFVLKARSPSCGLGTTPIVDAAGVELRRGDGLLAEALRGSFPGLPLIDEEGVRVEARRRAFVRAVRRRAKMGTAG